MVALLIALITAASFVWSPPVGAHPMKPVIPTGATLPDTAIVPTGATALSTATGPSETQAPPATADTALLLLVVLACALAGVPCLVRRLRRPTLALTTAGLLVTLLASSAPHLVHHAFEPGKAAECQMLQVASHADGALDTPDAPPLVLSAVRLDADSRLPARTVSAPSRRSRAPPA